MRSLYNILVLLALVFAVSCELAEQPQQEPAQMEFKITSANPMVVVAEGGDYAIEYTITAPDESLEVVVTNDTEWIRIKASSDSEPNTIRFAVEENEVEQSRSAVIVVTYDREYKVVVNQAAAKPEPKEILSTLTNDVDMVLDEDNSLVYADYFGNAYGDGRGMWQYWFMDVITKKMICLEVLTDSQNDATTEELYVPTGEFQTTEDITTYDVLVKGYRISDMDGLYDGGSWYQQIATEHQSEAYGPIAEGVMNVKLSKNGTDFDVTFEVKDDAGNTITGVYYGDIIIEDFR